MALGDARDPGTSDPMNIRLKLRPHWRRASARQFERVFSGWGGKYQELLDRLDEVVCQAFEKAPHLPVAGTSSAMPLNEKLQVYLLVLDETVALRAMDMCSKYSVLVKMRPIPMEGMDRWKFVPSWRFGPIPPARGLRCSGALGRVRWIDGLSGEIEFGRIFVWRATSAPN